MCVKLSAVYLSYNFFMMKLKRKKKLSPRMTYGYEKITWNSTKIVAPYGTATVKIEENN